MQMMHCVRILLLGAGLAAFPAVARDLPTPPKKDVPYVLHVSDLLETEQAVAVEESTKKEQRYSVPGPQSSCRTPLGFPEFAFAAEAINPESLELYPFEVADGRRQILIRKKNKIVAQPVLVRVMREGEGLFRIRVTGSLRPGEYCLTPQGADTVFCFGVD